jgi:iron complex transport system ATP-binding protein
MSVLSVTQLSIGYQLSPLEKKVVASGINLTLPKGELVCLLGPNGAGKSTLMRTLSGMQKPLHGSVVLDEVNIHEIPARSLAKKLSVVLTERVEGGLLTAYEVVSLGRYPYTNWSGTLSEHDHAIVAESIRQVGAEELATRTLTELSDGERQKIMMARALTQEPQVMILDEVTAFLDLPRRVEFMRLLRKMAHETNRAILLSTHDLDLALRSADKIWLLPKGGALVEGAPEDLVLDGSFQKAFASEGIQFDSATGSFNIHTSLTPRVYLTGSLEVCGWTQRSLERIGLTCTTSQDLASIHVNAEVDGWKVRLNGKETIHKTIYEFIKHIKTEAT